MVSTDGIVRPAKFAHVVFRTTRLAEMRAWYCAVLGARVVYEDAMLCFLTYDDEHHRLAFLQIPGLEERPPTAAGLDHVSYAYASLADLLGTYERLKAAGITPHWTINHGPTTSCYYRDPDGNQVELQIDNFTDQAELDAFMRGPFRENPIGVNFDADALLERFRRGVPVAELLKQAVAPA